MMRIGWIVAALLLLLAGGVTYAQPDAPPLVQSALDAIFVVDDAAQQVTLYARTLYRPLTQPALWVVPLPAQPDAIDWLTSAHGAFDALDGETRAYIEAPYGGECSLAPRFAAADGYLPNPQIAPARLIEDAEPVVLPDAAAVRALADQTGAAPTVSQTVLAALPAGWTIAAAALAPSAPRSDSFWDTHAVDATPVVRATFSYADDAERDALLALPLAWRAAALEAVLIDAVNPGSLALTVYIAADHPYTLADAALTPIDLRAVPGGYDWTDNILTDVLGPLFFFGSLQPGYDALVTRALAVDRPSFVREYVGAPVDSANHAHWLRDQQDSLRLLDTLSAQTTLTRLYALYRQALPDVGAHPVAHFAPDPAAALLRLNYTTAVDPAWFFGCTTRRSVDPALEARLPAGRTRIDALHLDIAHPVGWTLTTIAPPGATDEAAAPIYVLAPADAPPDHLARLEAGTQDGPPVLALQAFTGPYVEAGEFGIAPFDPSGDPFTTDAPAPGVARLDAVRYFPTDRAASRSDSAQVEGVRLAIVAPAADFAAHEALYRDLLAYSLSYPYLLDGALRHTLFEGSLSQLISIGYPVDWVEILIAGQRHIVPRAALGLAVDAPVGDTRGLALLDEAAPWVRLHRFNEETERDALLADGLGLDAAALGDSIGAPVSFRHAGRMGFIRTQMTEGRRSTYGVIVEVSAPVDDADSAALVAHMADAIHINGVDRWTDLP